MWDPAAIARYEELGVANGAGWIQAWRLAPLGETPPAVVASLTYSISSEVIDLLFGLWRGVTDVDSICAVRDAAIEPGLESIAPGLSKAIGPLATDLWRGVDAMHPGARPLFAAHRAEPRPGPDQPVLSAWRAVNCLRELRGDNHWALCVAAHLDDVEVGLLHSALIDVSEYGSEEWIARSRGADDEAIGRGWARLEAKGLATGSALNDSGRDFRLDLERRTDEVTASVWQEVGATATTALCDAVEPHHDAFVDRINATAGPRWMPASRTGT